MLYATHTWVTTNYRNYNVGFMRWAGFLFSSELKYTALWFFEVIPKLLAIEAIALFWALWRYGLASQAVRAALLLLALSAVGSIYYFPDIVHVAFVVPFVLVVCAGMIYRARTAFAWAGTPVARAVVRLGWAAALVVVLAKGWINFGFAWEDNPVLYSTAFGTLAGRAEQRDTIRDLRQQLHVDAADPPRLFAYPTDAWLYLALPADNPTPFSLLRPIYNTPEQFQTAIKKLDADPQAIIVLNLFAGLFAQKGDPFMPYLNANWHDVGGIGPGVILGAPLYRLFIRNREK
jgi:hypothetical protein